MRAFLCVGIYICRGAKERRVSEINHLHIDLDLIKYSNDKL